MLLKIFHGLGHIFLFFFRRKSTNENGPSVLNINGERFQSSLWTRSLFVYLLFHVLVRVGLYDEFVKLFRYMSARNLKSDVFCTTIVNGSFFFSRLACYFCSIYRRVFGVLIHFNTSLYLEFKDCGGCC